MKRDIVEYVSRCLTTMATTIEQQVALDEALVPSAQRFLGHSAQIKTLNDVNVNKLFQPWRSFAAVINKCLTGKSSGINSLRATSPTNPLDVERTEAEQLKIVLRRSRQETHISQQESGEGDDEETESDGESEEEETREEAEDSFDPIPTTLEDSEDDGNGEKDQGLRISEEERMHEEEEADELYRNVDINQGRGLQVSQDIEDSYVTLTLVHSDGQQESSSTSSFVTSLLNLIIDPGMESIFMTASSFVAPLPSPTSTMTPSIMTTTTTASQPPIPPTPIPSEVLQNLLTFKSVFGFEDRVKSLEVNFSEFIRTNQYPEAVSNIPDDLSEMELKKILIDKMEGNKSIQRSDEQQNLYKALEGPFAGSDRGSKRRREGGEHASASTPSEPATRSAGRSTTGTQSRQMSASESAFAEEPVQTTYQMDEPSHPVFETGNAQSWISELAKQTDARFSFNKLLDTPIDFSNFIMNRLDVDTLTPELLAGPTYELMRGSCNNLTELEYHLEEVYKATMDQLDWVHPEGQQYPHNLLQPLPLIPDNRGRRVIPFEHFIDNDLEYLWGGTSSRKYTTSVTKTKAADYGHIKWIEDLVPHWISVRRDDEKIYKFKEGNFKRLRLQDIEDMLLLLVQGNLSNLTVEEHFPFNVSLRMFTKSIVIQRRVKDLQLGYLPTIIWRKGDKDRAAAMIQAIDKMLETRRIMRSLERFVGGRQYEGDFRMLQKTI
nr:hypothetical protein [Tanacetum cinerariifolium]